MSTLYEQLGGEAAVNAAVDIFYRKVLTDERIRHFFDTVDMERQHKKQKAFLTIALEGLIITAAKTCVKDISTST